MELTTNPPRATQSAPEPLSRRIWRLSLPLGLGMLVGLLFGAHYLVS